MQTAEELLADEVQSLHDWLKDDVNVIDLLSYLRLKLIEYPNL